MNREQELMSALAKTTFRLHGQLVAIGEALARPSGMTGASWQVLAAVLRTPLPVADVAREIGVTRQSVQRVADLLVAQGLADYQPNPRHRRAKLLTATPAGRDAIRRIAPGMRPSRRGWRASWEWRPWRTRSLPCAVCRRPWRRCRRGRVALANGALWC